MIRETSKIVAAYLGNHEVAVADIPDLIHSTYSALVATSSPVSELVERQPAVSIRKSVTPDAIICLECGKPQKMLKRHLLTAHDLSPEEYRSRWSLASDYPLVAPSYAARRSELAIAIGLGTTRKRGKPQETPVTKDTTLRLTKKVKERPIVETPPSEEAVPEEKPSKGHSYPASRWAKPAG
jgi:predicted transcriptional regulator